MLVHLDSAHLSWLQTARKEDPQPLARFVDAWREAGAELCLSVHHLLEIAQLGDEARMRERLHTLTLFPSIRCGYVGWNHVAEREITLQLIAAATATARADYPTLRTELFPRISTETLEAAVFKCKEQFAELRKLTALSAELDNYWRFGVAFAKLGMPTPQLRNAMKIVPVSVPRDGDESQSWQLDGSRRFSGGPSKLLKLLRHPLETREERLRSLEIDGMEAAKGVDYEDLGDLALFAMLARNQAERLEDKCPAATEHVRRLDPWQCPGFRLWAAAERARRRAAKRSAPGDIVDSHHLVFAAYTDSAFVDKRTFEFLAQEARVERGGLTVDVLGVVRRAANLDDIAQAIRDAASG